MPPSKEAKLTPAERGKGVKKKSTTKRQRVETPNPLRHTFFLTRQKRPAVGLRAGKNRGGMAKKKLAEKKRASRGRVKKERLNSTTVAQKTTP